MDLLDEEPQENFLKKAAKKNLRNSLIALVLLILSIVTFLIGADSFYTVNNNLLSETLVVIFYGLMFIAVALAIITLVSSFKAIRKSKDNKNYIAIGIAILVLLAVINEVL